VEITLSRVDGALGINPAPAYLTNYLQYSHRSFGFEGYKKVNKYDKKQLYSINPDGGLVTFPGFHTKVRELIERNDDTINELDLRTPAGEPDIQRILDINWKGIDSTGLRDYQLDPVLEFLYKAKDTNGICCATGG